VVELKDRPRLYAAMSANGYWSSDLGWCDKPGDATLFGVDATPEIPMGRGISVLDLAREDVCRLPSLEVLSSMALALAESLRSASLTLLSAEARSVLMLKTFEHFFPEEDIAFSALGTLEALYEKLAQERKRIHEHVASRML
jgi:hypothetical protein